MLPIKRLLEYIEENENSCGIFTKDQMIKEFMELENIPENEFIGLQNIVKRIQN